MSRLVTAYRPMPRQCAIAVEGYPFIGISLAATLVFAAMGAEALAGVGIMGAIAIALFFRNPNRAIPMSARCIVSPADGTVLSVTPCTAPITEMPSLRISIFLSIFNVHINRAPLAAKVKRVQYHPGKFFVASCDKASEQNERNLIVLADERGQEIVLSQVAGLVARRIVCYLKEGMPVDRGERLGLIRFGSRVDLYLPPHARIEVTPGDKLRGGSSLIGYLP